MKYSDHYLLGKFAAETFQIEKPWQRFFFLCGNVMPDLDKLSYAQGYRSLKKRLSELGRRLTLNERRRLLIAGHTAEGSRNYVNKMTRQLRTKKAARPAWSWLDWYRFGKAVHYVADRFTYPHTLRYRGGFFRHVDYEEWLHLRFCIMLRRLKNAVRRNADAADENRRALRELVEECLGKVPLDGMYKAYRQERRDADTDCLYILSACTKYMDYVMKPA